MNCNHSGSMSSVCFLSATHPNVLAGRATGAFHLPRHLCPLCGSTFARMHFSSADLQTLASIRALFSRRDDFDCDGCSRGTRTLVSWLKPSVRTPPRAIMLERATAVKWAFFRVHMATAKHHSQSAVRSRALARNLIALRVGGCLLR